MSANSFSFNYRLLRRSQGQSSLSAGAYNAGVRLTNQLNGEVHDFSGKKGVVHSEITLPDGPMPPWAMNREALWNAAEGAHKKAQTKTAQPARNSIIALPHEWSDESRQRVMREIAQGHATRYRCAVDWSIHLPDGRGNKRNDHGHMLLSTNVIGADGFGGKVDRDAWDNIARRKSGPEPATEGAVEWGRRFACACINAEFERLDMPDRWDHRTLTEQMDEAQAFATEADAEAEEARAAGDEPSAKMWEHRAAEHRERADELNREPTAHVGQAGMARERKRYEAERQEALRLEAFARQAASEARSTGNESEAREYERQAHVHRDRAAEIEHEPTTTLIELEAATTTDTPLNGSDRVETKLRARLRRNGERRRDREAQLTQAIVVDTPKMAEPKTPSPAPRPMSVRPTKSKPEAVALKPRAPMQSTVRAWQPTRQDLQAYKLRLLERAYEAQLAETLASYLKFVKTPKGEQLAQLRRQAGIGGGSSWLAIELNDGAKIHDQGDALIVRQQTRVAIMAMVEIARAKGWERVEVFGEELFRRAAWLEYALNGIEAHGYEPNNDDQRTLDRLREAQEILAREEAERRQAQQEKDRALGKYYEDYENRPTP